MNTEDSNVTGVHIITINNNTLNIAIPLNYLIFAIQNRGDERYIVANQDKLLPAFKQQLENYAESNATELGLSEFQYLLDRITDAIYEWGDDVIIEADTDFDDN